MPASSATVVGSIHNVCTEAAFLLLAMLRSMLNLVRTIFIFIIIHDDGNNNNNVLVFG